jgi:hypothetical protein
VKTKEPRNEPCGTPDNKNLTSDKIPSTETLCGQTGPEEQEILVYIFHPT